MNKDTAKDQILEMAMSTDKKTVRSFYAFDSTDNNEAVLKRFNLWSRRFFPTYFKSEQASFHDQITLNNLAVYRGELKYFVDIVFRGGGKTSMTKLFIAFVIANDLDATRKYFKILTKDQQNAKQITTDLYNMLVTVKEYYPDVFSKSDLKREETQGSFTTSKGVKVRSGTVGTEQRGQIQDSSRPDFVVFDDFETRKSLSSPAETKSVWDNMEEARTGLSKDGGCVYLCNYISERGNVHRLVEKGDIDGWKVLIIPILTDGEPTWGAYTREEINRIRLEADDFDGEYMCEPAAGHDIVYDRRAIESMPTLDPIKDLNGFKIYHEYDPSHAYAIGADVAGGVGLDSSASVVIDFSTVPARVVATYASNEITPEAFGYELLRQGEAFGNCIIAPENNIYDSCISTLKSHYDDIYYTERSDIIVSNNTRPRTYGWNTNSLTKPRMLLDLQKAISDGLITIPDKNLKNELKSYTRDDLMDRAVDPRLTTKHFDLLMALCIGWQMRSHAKIGENTKNGYNIEEQRNQVNRAKARLRAQGLIR